jgi:hypothetical protein
MRRKGTSSSPELLLEAFNTFRWKFGVEIWETRSGTRDAQIWHNNLCNLLRIDNARDRAVREKAEEAEEKQ